MAEFISKTVACKNIQVTASGEQPGQRALDELFAKLRSNRTVKKLEIAVVSTFLIVPCSL